MSSSSMSPPPQRPGGSPYVAPFRDNAASPSNPSPYGQPPAKRQRLSPDPRSPQNGGPIGFGAPAQSQVGGPVTSAYGNPYATQSNQTTQSPQSHAAGSQSSFNTPQPYPFQQMPWQSHSGAPSSASPATGPSATGQGSPPQLSREMMPPPPRPVREEREEKVGVEEIGDSLYGSGINLKEEENYMHNVYNNRHAGESFSTSQSQSFGSTTVSAGNSFNDLTRDTSFGSQEPNGAFAGTIGRPRTQEEIELEERKKRETAAKARAERVQHHLNNQFLLCNNIRKRIDIAARNHGVTFNPTGLYVRQPQTVTVVNGAGTQGIVATEQNARSAKLEERPEATVSQGAPFEHMLALVSLAAGERIRGLLDESLALARARRFGDHGRVVPLEFIDVADGEGKRTEGKIAPENVTRSQWDKIPESSPGDVDMLGNERPNPATPQPEPTLSFQGTLNNSLRDLAERDRQAEKARNKKREARRRAADSTLNGESATADTPVDSSTPSGPTDAAAPVKISKKEQAKQQKEKNSEAHTHHTVNQTAAMMSLGRKGNRYSWMSGGAANLPTNRFAKPSTSGTATPAGVKQEALSPAAGGVTMGRSASGAGAEPQWGDYMEDGADGKGLQLRDWILVLERDGREKVALQKALLKLA